MGLFIGGLILGSVYALLVVGLVLIYRTSGAFNFAQGSVGAVGAFITITLASRQVPLWLAVVFGLVASGVASALVYLTCIRPLEVRRAGVLATMVTTLGVSTIAGGLLAQFFGYNPYTFNLFPTADSVTILGTSLPLAGVVIIGSAAVGLGLFAWLLFGTRYGLALRMGASNAELTLLSGVSTFWLRLSIWVIAGVVAAWAIVLFAAYQEISTTVEVSFLLSASVAASWGAFRNIPLTLIGAVVVGVITNLITRYVDVPLTNTALLVLLSIVFVVRTRLDPGALWRGRVVLGSKAFEIRPHYKAARTGRRVAVGELVVALVIALGAMLLLSGGAQNTAELVIAYAIGVTGLALITRYAGRVNLGGAAYLAVGSYVYAIATGDHVWWVVALVGSVVAAGIVGALVGWVTHRMEDIYYVTLTLVLTASVADLALVLAHWTGGAEGMYVTPPAGSLFGMTLILGAMLLVGLGAALMFGLRRVGGRTLMLVADPSRAVASGVRRGFHMAAVEGLGAAIIGLSGAAVAVLGGYVSPTSVDVSVSVTLLAGVIIGGAWGPVGALAGAAFVVVLPTLLAGLTNWPPIVFGTALVVVVILWPGGFETVLAWIYSRAVERGAVTGRPAQGS